MAVELDLLDGEKENEAYFDDETVSGRRVFDGSLLEQSVEVLRMREPLVFGRQASTTDAMRAMQRHHRGCALVTEDGSLRSPLVGIFTERDVLLA